MTRYQLHVLIKKNKILIIKNKVIITLLHYYNNEIIELIGTTLFENYIHVTILAAIIL